MYDKEFEAIKSEVAKFEPMEKRDAIMKSISDLFEAPVTNSVTAPAPLATEQATLT